LLDAARRTPATAAGAGERPPLLTVEQVVDLADEVEYEDPETGRKCFDRLGFAKAVERNVREAIADYQRKQAALQEISDIGQEIEAAPLTGSIADALASRDAEIANLRAQLAQANESVAQYQQSTYELAEQLRAELASRSRAEGGHGAPDAGKSSPIGVQPDQRESAAEGCTHPFRTGEALEVARGAGKCATCGHSFAARSPAAQPVAKNEQ
jgi:hypothetical protein